MCVSFVAIKLEQNSVRLFNLLDTLLPLVVFAFEGDSVGWLRSRHFDKCCYLGLLLGTIKVHRHRKEIRTNIDDIEFGFRMRIML